MNTPIANTTVAQNNSTNQSNNYSIDTGPANQQTIWNYLKNAGLNDFAAAGIMGNMKAESDFKPANMQDSYESSPGFTDLTYTQQVDNGTYTKFKTDAIGYGLCQWTHSSLKSRFLDYAQQAKTSISNLNTQLNFLITDLTTVSEFIPLWRDLLTVTSYEAATVAFLTKYERPENYNSEATQTKRKNFAKEIYNKFASKDTLTLQYSRGNTTKLSTNYIAKDFDCPCGSCSSTLINTNIVNWIERINSKFNIKLNIKSGYRCAQYNRVYEEKGDGNFHTYGAAVDVILPGDADDGIKSKILAYAEGIGPTGIGNYIEGNWIHIDNRAEPSFWKYENSNKTILNTFGGPTQYPELFNGTATEENLEYTLSNPPLYLPQKNHSSYKSGVYFEENNSLKGVVFHFLPVFTDTTKHLQTLGEFLQPNDTDDVPTQAHWKSILGTNYFKTSLNQSPDSQGMHAYIGYIKDPDKGTSKITTVQAFPWGLSTNSINQLSLSEVSENFNYGWIHIGIYLAAPFKENAMAEIIKLMKYLNQLYNIHPMGLTENASYPMVTTPYELSLLGATNCSTPENIYINADILRHRLNEASTWGPQKTLHAYHINRIYNDINSAQIAYNNEEATMHHYLYASNIYFTNSNDSINSIIQNKYGLSIITKMVPSTKIIEKNLLNTKVQYLINDKVTLNKKKATAESANYDEQFYNLILYVSDINLADTTKIGLSSYYGGPTIIEVLRTHITKKFTNNDIGTWRAIKPNATFITGNLLPADLLNVFVISLGEHYAVISNNPNSPPLGIIYVDQFL